MRHMLTGGRSAGAPENRSAWGITQLRCVGPGGRSRSRMDDGGQIAAARSRSVQAAASQRIWSIDRVLEGRCALEARRSSAALSPDGLLWRVVGRKRRGAQVREMAAGGGAPAADSECGKGCAMRTRTCRYLRGRSRRCLAAPPSAPLRFPAARSSGVRRTTRAPGVSALAHRRPRCCKPRPIAPSWLSDGRVLVLRGAVQGRRSERVIVDPATARKQLPLFDHARRGTATVVSLARAAATHRDHHCSTSAGRAHRRSAEARSEFRFAALALHALRRACTRARPHRGCGWHAASGGNERRGAQNEGGPGAGADADSVRRVAGRPGPTQGSNHFNVVVRPVGGPAPAPRA